MKTRNLLPLILAVLALACAPVHAQRAAKAAAEVDPNGVVTGITITDAGDGYAIAPVVMVQGGGGSNALATAVLQEGAVAGIRVVHGGHGYTRTPVVAIAPPNAPITTLAMRVRTDQPRPLVEVVGEMGSSLELQAADSLAPGHAWTPIDTCVLTGNSWSVAVTNPTAAQRFYRAAVRRVERPERPASMIWLPPGTFLMGSEGPGVLAPANECPQTTVRLTQGFFLAVREVSQAQYLALMGTNPAALQGDTRLPVETVSWEEAAQYCARLTSAEQVAGRIPSTWRYRLPTEAEWEYAARAGGTGEYGFPVDEGSHYVWHSGGNFGETQPVGGLQPNPWGFYDLFGNVAEWCLDAYGEYPGGEAMDPAGATNGVYRVARGGSGRDSLDLLRTAARDAHPARNYREAWLGFRVALAPQYDRPVLTVNTAPAGGTISGGITNGWNGRAMRGVVVSLSQLVPSATTSGTPTNLPLRLAQTTTGEDGGYAFGSLKPGTYLVSCRLNNPELVCRFQLSGQAALPSFAVTNDSHTANFRGYIDVTGGGDLEDSQFEVSLFLSKVPNDTLLWDESRVYRTTWNWITTSEYPEKQEFTRHRPIKGITKLQWKATYGYNFLLWGRDNNFSTLLTFRALNPYRCEERIRLPITGCPKRNAFAWEVRSGRGLWPSAGLATPVAQPATLLQYPTVFTASWQPVAGAFGYIIEVSANGSFSDRPDGSPLASYDVGPVSQTAIDLGLAASLTTSYYYRVIAYGDAVLSEYSEPVQIGLNSVAAPVPTLSAIRRTGFTLDWERVPGALAYRVQVSTNLDFTSPLFLDRDVGTGTTVAVDGLPDATYCYYRVLVSGPRAGPTRDATQLQRGVEALPATTRTATGFTANWLPRSCWPAAPSYRVDLSSEPSFDTFLARDVDAGSALSTLITNLPALQPVFYRVRLSSPACGDVESYSTPVAVPCAPLLLPASDVTATGFTINWQNLPGASGYRLDIATDASFTDALLRDWDVGNRTQFTLSNLPPSGLPCFYRVRACAGAALSTDSATGIAQFTLPHLVWIPAGSFTMGGEEGSMNGPVWPAANELPQTRVTLTRGFWMDQFEVSAKQYDEVMGGGRTSTAALGWVSWPEATNYCARLTELERTAGRLPEDFTYRLPTEAEWEYACRAGTTTAFSFASNIEALMAHAHSLLEDTQWPFPVGARSPNPWGLYDMHGNVAEWCLDGPWTYPGGRMTNPVGPADPGGAHACRGGSFNANENWPGDDTMRRTDGAESWDDSWWTKRTGWLGKISSSTRFFSATSFDATGFRVVLAREARELRNEPKPKNPPADPQRQLQFLCR